MEFNPSNIEKKWKQKWVENKTYRVEIDTTKPKFYILDMFPYPSGAGLHVGHPLGYIASDIYARYKRLKGFNVLHPMGYDSFGLPAEQYAINTGIHPAVATEQNIARYREQLDNIGFSFDWSREVRTSDPKYYKWTQWIFMQIFNHYYDKAADKALPITDLIQKFETEGNKNIQAVSDENTPIISAADWNAMSERDKNIFLLKYRLTLPEETFVNWCPGLKAVLANEEIKDGVSERGGYPVEKKLMRQWSMRIIAYADRLIDGLDTIDWSDSLKEQQRNWMGRSRGASVKFPLENDPEIQIEVFTTRVDTLYGVTFMVLAPEHPLVKDLTTKKQKVEIETYINVTKSKSEIDRLSEVKKVSGAFTGSYCLHPMTGEKIPIYITDYVLAGYGTGAVMAVPSGDQRDWNFATHFGLPIVPISDAQRDLDKQADKTKEGHYINSEIINGLTYDAATEKIISVLEEKNLGKGKIQYRLRNAIFSRQRYWGEPVPVYWDNGVPHLIDEKDLPLALPAVDKYLPTDNGEPPLGRAANWKYKDKYDYELSTMPGWAGSSFYFYRYMDPQNDSEIVGKEAVDYWRGVDLYLGGTEHAVGHLLYSRFWNHFLFDLGLVPQREYAFKLLNQGMIQGRSLFLHTKSGRSFHVLIQLADDQDRLSFENFEKYIAQDNRFEGIDIENDIEWKTDAHGKKYTQLTAQVEKMSKSKFNVVNPDDVVAQYGADCFRLYEMFLGPVEQAKPWSTTGISGTQNFLRKLWSLFYDAGSGKYLITDTAPTPEELKVLHTGIKRITDDIERFSFNTCVSSFMVLVNGLKDLKCHKRAVLEPLVTMLAPFAPFTAEELWESLGHTTSVCDAQFPLFNEVYLKSDEVIYPISINGKRRGEVAFPTDTDTKHIEATVREMEVVKKWSETGIKKIIIVPGKMINVVV